MNQTGVGPPTCPFAAARKGEDVRVDMTSPTLLAVVGDASGGDRAARVTRPLFGARG
jgi:hypothetical protein